MAAGSGAAGSRPAIRCARRPPRARSRERAYAAGARFHEGETAWPWVIGAPRPRRARGGRAAPGGRGARGRRAVDARGDRPDARLAADRAGLGSGGGGRDGRPATARARGGGRGGRGRRRRAASIFSLVAADGQVSLGSTFLRRAARPAGLGGRLRRAGERFVPGLCAGRRSRACAPAPRPQSLDGRPLVGELPGAGGAVGGGGPRALGHLDGPGHRPHRGGGAARAGPRSRRRCRSARF